MSKSTGERLATVEATIPPLYSELKRMNSLLEGLDHVIRGNGTPGLRDDVEIIKTKLAGVEAGRNRWRDAVFTIGGGIVVGVAVFLFSQTWSVHHVSQSNMPQMQSKP